MDFTLKYKGCVAEEPHKPTPRNPFLPHRESGGFFGTHDVNLDDLPEADAEAIERRAEEWEREQAEAGLRRIRRTPKWAATATRVCKEWEPKRRKLGLSRAQRRALRRFAQLIVCGRVWHD